MAQNSYDYIVIGSGIAGLNTALLAQEHGSVLILTKGRIEDCNTLYAQGGIATALGPGDSPALHMQDTLAAGAGLCDPEAVSVLTQEGPQRVANLIQWGVPFDTSHGQIALGREGAHSMPRIVHAGGDATGRHIETTLAGRVSQSNIDVLEFALATKILVADGHVQGVEALDSATGETRTFTSRTCVLATGGAGRLFSHTTNPEVATGDGVALAFQAGASVMDLEFYQFHPTALNLEGAPSFLLSEAMRGEGAVLRDRQGRAFMAEYHPLADLAPRDVVSRAISGEMDRAGGGVFLDISHLPAETVQARFPTIYRFCMEHGLDITKEPAPVAPAAHYMMGGVRTDTWGRTNVQGLYACGEVACAAVHGANRLASNSLLDTLVFAQRVVASSLGQAPDFGMDRQPGSGPDPSPDPSNYEAEGDVVRAGLQSRQIVCASMPKLSLSALQDLMWRNVGISRHGSRLLLSARILQVWQQSMAAPVDLPTRELANMVLLARLMVEGALLRQEAGGPIIGRIFPAFRPNGRSI